MTFVASTTNASITRIRNIDAMVASLNAERAALVSGLIESAPSTGKFTFDTGSVTVSENNTYSEDAMRDLLSPGQVKRCTKSVLDKTVVKRLYPDVYAAAKQARGLKASVGA